MFDNTSSPSIDQILDAFARDDAMARHPATLHRFDATRARLASFLTTDGEEVLVPAERALLAAELQFATEGAFGRVFGAEVLIAALPGFLRPAWLPEHPFDARAQVRFVELLTHWVVAHGLVDAGEMSCFLYSVSDAARDARAWLHTDSPAGA